MALDVAFLRGINLGKRQMKMAELKTCLEEAGFSDVKTILASGNVRFQSKAGPAESKVLLEKTIEQQFGFKVGVVLRTEDEIKEMLAEHPFDRIDPKADVTRHVLMFDEPLPKGVVIDDKPGHTEIVRVDAKEIYIAGYRQPNGRYTEGVEEVLKPLYAKLGKGVLDTMRNWNTIEKVLK
ncbi:DUF1697 domain-containing protein [Devosia sp.]|uniref:DUF1697 domain-containing protein n=1 Tax=Devosia sp. TaxID=1871048 RepID=UPI001B055047|nr:DUF1697 domain-containing protein [Devosia sp.]MBO9590380.1 DUF1697 domain-containing protein [Devosia sp.]